MWIAPNKNQNKIENELRYIKLFHNYIVKILEQKIQTKFLLAWTKEGGELINFCAIF